MPTDNIPSSGVIIKVAGHFVSKYNACDARLKEMAIKFSYSFSTWAGVGGDGTSFPHCSASYLKLELKVPLLRARR